MNPISLADLEGEWVGTYQLWVMPDDPVRESPSTATVASVAQGRFATLRYTWEEGGRPQDGLLLIPAGTDKADVVWVDSWHMGDAFLSSAHEAGTGDLVNARGSYAAPPGPDWGWRTVIRSESRDAFRLLMFNITPDGEEALAVQVAYTRHR